MKQEGVSTIYLTKPEEEQLKPGVEEPIGRFFTRILYQTMHMYQENPKAEATKVGLYISFGDWANALECWRSPSLRLVIPGIAVSPGVTHSDSRIVFVTGTVVKPQTTNQPTNQPRRPKGSE